MYASFVEMALALIAHDGKKDEMADFVRRYADLLKDFKLVGTGTTATLIQKACGLQIEGVLSGPRGGDVQIAARVLSGEVKAVFFFVEPMDAHPHEPDIQTLQRTCNITNTPLATNPASAELLLKSLTA